MPLDPSYVGRTYPPTPPYEVGREKIREFADAVGDPNPAYRDVDAAKELGHPDVIAPPTFPVIISMRASEQIIDDAALGLDYSRVVHGEQRFVHHRPIFPGDRLTATVTIESITSRAGHDILSTRTDIASVDGDLVVTAYATLVARGEGA